ncbi:MAG: hypothetical protein JO013_15095 [Alphaproteobacteria bacterium]|nr:hypothetical protein [Alphaproteobacteria bacterium]
MRLRLLVLASLAAITMAAPGAGRPKPARIDPGTLYAQHLARLRSVFREAYAPDVEFSAIVYSSGYPEQLIALRRSGDSYEVFAREPARAIWTYGMVQQFRSRLIAKVRVKTGGRMEDLSDAEADRLASTVPADPRDLKLSGCAAPIEPRMAAQLVATWQHLFTRVPESAASGVPGLMGTYLIRTGKDERELFLSQWMPAGPAKRVIRLVDALYRVCRDGRPDGRVTDEEFLEALATPPAP